jgi:hypothetical protein
MPNVDGALGFDRSLQTPHTLQKKDDYFTVLNGMAVARKSLDFLSLSEF